MRRSSSGLADHPACSESTVNAANGCKNCAVSGTAIKTSSAGGYTNDYASYIADLVRRCTSSAGLTTQDTWCSAAPRCFSTNRNAAVSGGACPIANTAVAAPEVQPIAGSSETVPIGASVGRA